MTETQRDNRLPRNQKATLKQNKNFRPAILLVVLALLGGVLFRCTKHQGVRDQARRPNIILIGLDALRADHLGIYGYSKETSPQIDAFAQQSVVFDTAISQAAWTTPSFMSLLTSLYPSVHKLMEYPNPGQLDDNIISWPVLMKAEGYLTASFNGGGYLSGKFGFDRGFDHFVSGQMYYKNAPRLFRDALAWIGRQQDQPFFLFLHTYSVHRPYWPPPVYRTRFFLESETEIDHTFSLPPREWDHWQDRIKAGRIDGEDIRKITALYDAEISYVDEAFGRFIQELKLSGVFDRSVIILTADHGDELFDHGQIDHIRTVYQELIHVPLIIKIPGAAPERIQGWMESIDIMPTILELIGLDCPAVQGESMLKAINKGKMLRTYAFSEGGKKGSIKALLSREWKYIYDTSTQTEELYHLLKDPAESQNLVRDYQRVRENMRTHLQRILSANAELSKNYVQRTVDLDKDLKRKLRSLGYLR